jgi:hypothetical protein
MCGRTPRSNHLFLIILHHITVAIDKAFMLMLRLALSIAATRIVYAAVACTLFMLMRRLALSIAVTRMLFLLLRCTLFM